MSTKDCWRPQYGSFHPEILYDVLIFPLAKVHDDTNERRAVYTVLVRISYIFTGVSNLEDGT